MISQAYYTASYTRDLLCISFLATEQLESSMHGKLQNDWIFFFIWGGYTNTNAYACTIYRPQSQIVHQNFKQAKCYNRHSFCFTMTTCLKLTFQLLLVFLVGFVSLCPLLFFCFSCSLMLFLHEFGNFSISGLRYSEA